MSSTGFSTSPRTRRSDHSSTIYVVVVVVNYLAFILGVSSLLTALGVDYRFARLGAGACEAVFMYSMMRWVVFR